MHHVVVRAVAQVVVDKEGPKAVFFYPSEVADRGKYCGIIEHWSTAKTWSGVCKKLEAASEDLKKRVDRVNEARAHIGPKAEEAGELAMHGGTVAFEDDEFKLLQSVCNAIGRMPFFQATPEQCLPPFGLMLLWPILESLSKDVGEAMEAPVIDGWLTPD